MPLRPWLAAAAGGTGVAAVAVSTTVARGKARPVVHGR